MYTFYKIIFIKINKKNTKLEHISIISIFHFLALGDSYLNNSLFVPSQAKIAVFV